MHRLSHDGERVIVIEHVILYETLAKAIVLVARSMIRRA